MGPRNSGSILPLHDRTLRNGRRSNSTAPSSRPRARLSRRPSRNHSHRPRNLRHPRFSFIPNRVRNEGLAFIAELSGTFMFLLIAFGSTQVANAAASTAGDSSTANGSLSQAPNASTLQYIALAFGFSLAINVWIFFRISGGLFNPCVSLALYLVGAIKATRAVVCFVAQVIGAIFAAAVVRWLLPGPLNVSTALGATTSVAQGLFLEMFLTTELVLAILFLAAEKHKATFLAPIGIGLALFVAELMGVYFTGGSLNPVRSFGPAVVTRNFDGHHWIYWLGPTMGSLLATGFYKLMKYGEYETVNPGQDFNDQEAELFSPPDDPVTAEEVARPDPVALAAGEAVRYEMSPERSRGRSLAAVRSQQSTGGALENDDEDIEAGAADERRRKEEGAEVVM